MKFATCLAALAIVSRAANDDDEKNDEEEEQWRRMSTSGCISSADATDGYIGYTVGEYWTGADLNPSAEDEDGWGKYVNQTLPWDQDGKHFVLDADMSELARIEACAGIRDIYLDALAANFTEMGWFLFIKEGDDAEFNCHLETYTQANENGEGGGQMVLTDCNEIDQEDRKRRRLEDDGNWDNEVEGCDGDFIRSSSLVSDLGDECTATCGDAEELVHKFAAGEPELIVVPIGTTVSFDLSGLDDDAVIYEFGTLDGCDACVIEEGAEDNNYNRVLANRTDTTSLVLQSVGYRCFAAKDPDDDEAGCLTRTVFRVDPCDLAVSSQISVNDTDGGFTEEMGFYHLRGLLTGCGFDVDANYTAVFDETIEDVLPSLFNESAPLIVGVKDVSIAVFQFEDGLDTDEANILECLTNVTSLSEVLGYEVVGAKEVTPSPTPEPDNGDSEEADTESGGSSPVIYIGVAAVVVIVLGVALYFCWPSGSKGHQPLKDEGANYGAASA